MPKPGEHKTVQARILGRRAGNRKDVRAASSLVRFGNELADAVNPNFLSQIERE